MCFGLVCSRDALNERDATGRSCISRSSAMSSISATTSLRSDWLVASNASSIG